jgi:hypothetical protein
LGGYQNQVGFDGFIGQQALKKTVANLRTSTQYILQIPAQDIAELGIPPVGDKGDFFHYSSVQGTSMRPYRLPAGQSRTALLHDLSQSSRISAPSAGGLLTPPAAHQSVASVQPANGCQNNNPIIISFEASDVLI